ncbi:GLUG motif-containing protein [Methanolapillus millepedarum]|uniref:GLUG domain-containing protein n=1 Tax=Methanolapillus millepedarum TaxID=3028296 RepID=A0AA96ZW84_9EURY|nr:hypothetical protein MsAc7_12290 [Methanosarcinaceae archaeon Ac7]
MIKAVIIILVTLFLIILFPNATFAFSGSGTGTPNDPFQITTINQLDEIRNNLSASYILMNDLDFAGSDLVWEPIGSEENPFFGQFNGNNQTIQNLQITPQINSFSGLFGYVNRSGEISNLNLAHATASGYGGIGVLAGLNEGLIQNCSATDINIGGHSDEIGGLVGINNGTILDSFATGTILSGREKVGGLAGRNGGFIDRSYASVTIEHSKYYAGGLVGLNYQGKIQNCYALGSVSAESGVGGLVGYNYEGLIDACYATGNVFTETDCAGGLIGQNHGFVKYSYALNERVDVGSQYFSDKNVDKKTIGRIIGWNEDYFNAGSVYECSYWDKIATNAKFRKNLDSELVRTVTSEDIWGTFGKSNWNGFNNGWILKNFSDNMLPIFDWQSESPGDVSYLDPENSNSGSSQSIPGFEFISSVLMFAGVVLLFGKGK